MLKRSEHKLVMKDFVSNCPVDFIFNLIMIIMVNN